MFGVATPKTPIRRSTKVAKEVRVISPEVRTKELRTMLLGKERQRWYTWFDDAISIINTLVVEGWFAKPTRVGLVKIREAHVQPEGKWCRLAVNVLAYTNLDAVADIGATTTSNDRMLSVIVRQHLACSLFDSYNGLGKKSECSLPNFGRINVLPRALSLIHALLQDIRSTPRASVLLRKKKEEARAGTQIQEPVRLLIEAGTDGDQSEMDNNNNNLCGFVLSLAAFMLRVGSMEDAQGKQELERFLHALPTEFKKEDTAAFCHLILTNRAVSPRALASLGHGTVGRQKHIAFALVLLGHDDETCYVHIPGQGPRSVGCGDWAAWPGILPVLMVNLDGEKKPRSPSQSLLLRVPLCSWHVLGGLDCQTNVQRPAVSSGPAKRVQVDMEVRSVELGCVPPHAFRAALLEGRCIHTPIHAPSLVDGLAPST